MTEIETETGNQESILNDNIEVAEDSDLLPQEKQLSFTTSKADEHFHVHSEIASITRWLLEHPAFECERVRKDTEGVIVACTGKFPIGVMNLSPKPRKRNQFCYITSTRELRE